MFSNSKIYFYYGREYYNQAITYFKKSLAHGNERVDLLYTLGLVYSNLAQYDDSNQILERALELEESEIVALAIGLNHFKKEDFPKALQYFDIAINIQNDKRITEQALLKKAEIQFLQKEYSSSLENLNTVIMLNSNNVEAFYLRGEIYSEYNKDMVKARSEYRKAININPSFIKAYKKL